MAGLKFWEDWAYTFHIGPGETLSVCTGDKVKLNDGNWFYITKSGNYTLQDLRCLELST